MQEVTITISDDLFRYLLFLERSRFIKSKEEALSTALEFYKRLAMHDWLPNSYRMGGGRVVLMDTVMLSDLFHAMTNTEIYNAARATALKRKVTNPFFSGMDFMNPDNWQLILREMEIMGWGKFTLFKDEIRVEFCPLPTPYLMGYFETMFGVKFVRHPSKIPGVTVFLPEKGRKKALA